ncbi:MAG TPA: T9SS type A sorting domain-containing protein, partial [Rhodothermales bacterium]
RDLYVIEYGSGDVWRVRLPGTNVAAESAELPDRLVLEQNYPNPFNPNTNVRFELPEAGNVRLTVHDALGREVLRPVDGHLTAGAHSVTLSMANLPSGAYFYRLTTGSQSITRTMVLAK